MINQLNLTPYPLDNFQTVYTQQGNTSLELVGEVAKKVNECVEIVNGVDAIATQSRQVVEEMRLAEDTFLSGATDIHNKLIADNTVALNDLKASNDTVKGQMQTEFNTFKDALNTNLGTTKSSMDLALQNYKDGANTQLNTFTAGLETTKTNVTNAANTVINNSKQLIADDVNTKLEAMHTDGTLSSIINDELLTNVNNQVNINSIVVSDTAPTIAQNWYDIKSETEFQVTDNMFFVDL
jgi:ElaB/YqjD/DUF883 family membrane-anchored ribosome-binding protein